MSALRIPRRAETGEATSGDRDLLFSAIVGVLALLPRLYVAIAWTREPVWDGHYYDFGARRIAAGLGYSDGTTTWHPWCHWPVGYSAILAAVYRVFGDGPRAATVFNAVTGALLAVFVHRLARYELSPLRARLAALLSALYPGLIIYSALVMTEPLSALTLVVAGWFLLRHRAERPRLGAALFGVTLGFGALVHPTFLAHAPGAVLLVSDRLAAAFRAPRVRTTLATGAIAMACTLLPILPWTLRNCRVMDRCALVSTNGGWNLAIGAFPRATGRFETLRSSDGCRVVTGQVQQDTCWRDLAIQMIRADPGRWLGLVPKKLAYTFDHESYPVEYLHEADPDRWAEDTRRRGRGLLTGAHRALLTAAALGVVPHPRGRPIVAAVVGAAVVALALFVWQSDETPFYLLAAAAATLGWLAVRASGRLGSPGPVTRWALFSLLGTLLTHAVFFGEDRYHIVVTPMLCLLAASALRTHAEDTPKLPQSSERAGVAA